MSSLAAARADNFYYPTDFDPVKHKSLNKYQGQHALRERAAKLDQGILVIRFEVPYHIICTKCNEMVAKGERFNADKKSIGQYHSTKIWEFRMRHHCGSCIVIVTDPKNSKYIVVEGARQKAEEYTAADAGVIELTDDKEREKLRSDPLYMLEHGEKAKVKARTDAEELSDLLDANDARHRDDYGINKLLRARMRKAKAEDAGLDSRRDALGLPSSVSLLPEADEDSIAASIAFLSDNTRFRGTHLRARAAIMAQSIFKGSGRSGSARSSAGALALPAGLVAASSGAGGSARELSERVRPLPASASASVGSSRAHVASSATADADVLPGSSSGRVLQGAEHGQSERRSSSAPTPRDAELSVLRGGQGVERLSSPAQTISSERDARKALPSLTVGQGTGPSAGPSVGEGPSGVSGCAPASASGRCVSGGPSQRPVDAAGSIAGRAVRPPPGSGALAAAEALRVQQARARALAQLLPGGQGTYLVSDRSGRGGKGGGPVGRAGRPGTAGHAGPAGLGFSGKRSLKEKAELLAKRQRLGGMQLQLGGVH